MIITLKPAITRATTYGDLMYYVMRGILTIAEVNQQFKALGVRS